MTINKPIIKIPIKNVIKHNTNASYMYLVVASLASLDLCGSAIKVKVWLLECC